MDAGKSVSPEKVRAAKIAAVIFLLAIIGAPVVVIVSIWNALSPGRAQSAEVSIHQDVVRNPSEYAAARIARNTLLSSCGTIMMMTPSTREPGGWIIDCANGDRYRMAPGSNSARFERSYPPDRR